MAGVLKGCCIHHEGIMQKMEALVNSFLRLCVVVSCDSHYKKCNIQYLRASIAQLLTFQYSYAYSLFKN